MIRLNLIQLFTSASVFMCLVYIPLVAEDLGATHTEIGIIGAVYGIALFTSSYIFGRATDIYPPKLLLYAGCMTCALFFFLQTLATTPGSLGLIRALAGFSTGILPAALISYVHTMGRNVGKFVSFGALGWALGAVVAGVVARLSGDLNGIFIVSSIFFIASAVLLIGLPQVSERYHDGDLPSTITIKKNFAIYATFFARHTAACSIWIIFPLYLKALGAGALEIGVLYAVNPISQFVIMQQIKTHNSERLIEIGHVASVAAFVSISLLTSYSQAVLSMFLIAVSWSFLYVGSILTLLKENPSSRGTAIGILSSAISIAAVGGSFLGGGLSDLAQSLLSSDLMAYRVVCGLAAIISAAGFISYRVSRSRMRSKRSYLQSR
ncbi:Major Facilitator Superfamily protein [Candidatus Methanoperedenaceae archaeon GB50]|nr:MAG: Major Facilitator Superfamily protein [Candidatus Methanoperedenaceae archaeon GB50]CAD7776686.1 Major Facilitator Superfamily protein [Candidatus Methanoperedenaceae archaeon GB50]